MTGPRAVGTSTVGFGLASSAWQQGTPTAFVDLEQLAFLRDPEATSHVNLGLGTANTAALHHLFASQGADSIVVSSHLGDSSNLERLRSAAAHAAVTVIRLRASEATLRAHVRERAGGSPARLAGDDLTNASTVYQEQVVRAGLAHQQALDDQAHEDIVIDVSGRTAGSVIEELTKRLNQSVRARRRRRRVPLSRTDDRSTPRSRRPTA